MSTTTPSYDINYDDERFQAVETEKSEALSEIEKTYQGMIDQSDNFYKNQIEASKEWADKQSQLQQEQTDFTIEQIEQQKEQAHKDYIKEQSGSYKDWQKQSDKYGVNAEQMASSGMVNTGFSESSQVAMYNQYQNRVVTAREVFNRSILTYDNNIKEARLQNSSILAEIAYNALVAQNQLALEGFQYKNNLILEKANKKIEVENIYHDRWQDVLAQMNTEAAMNFEQDMLDDDNDTGGETFFDKTIYDTGSFTTEDKPTESGDEGGDVSVNYDSVYALGVGSLTEEELADLVAQDYVIMTIENGEYVFRWSVTKEAQKKKTQLENRYKDQQAREVERIVNEIRGNYEVNTEYYRGNKNKDAIAYGTFKNGYQPKGITGHGKLKATKEKITFTTTTLNGESKTVTQNVWKAADGTKWYWDGRYNKYIEYKPSGGVAGNG